MPLMSRKKKRRDAELAENANKKRKSGKSGKIEKRKRTKESHTIALNVLPTTKFKSFFPRILKKRRYMEECKKTLKNKYLIFLCFFYFVLIKQ
jgi:hypothetical protein